MDFVIGLTFAMRKFELPIFEPERELYTDKVDGIMVSYAEVLKSPKFQRTVWKQGAHRTFNLVPGTKVYFDNGSFSFATTKYEGTLQAYEQLMDRVDPYWKAMPRDYIPSTAMTQQESDDCMRRTMENNMQYANTDYALMLHSGLSFESYLKWFRDMPTIRHPKFVALGPVSQPINAINNLCYSLSLTRATFPESHLHVLGVGGRRSTTHIATLLGADSTDSTGWWVLAARFDAVISPNPAKTVLYVVDKEFEREKKPTAEDYAELEECECGACKGRTLEDLRSPDTYGKQIRAAHNLYMLMKEKNDVKFNLDRGNYEDWMKKRHHKFYRHLQTIMESHKNKQLELF